MRSQAILEPAKTMDEFIMRYAPMLSEELKNALKSFPLHLALTPEGQKSVKVSESSAQASLELAVRYENHIQTYFNDYGRPWRLIHKWDELRVAYNIPRPELLILMDRASSVNAFFKLDEGMFSNFPLFEHKVCVQIVRMMKEEKTLRTIAMNSNIQAIVPRVVENKASSSSSLSSSSLITSALPASVKVEEKAAISDSALNKYAGHTQEYLNRFEGKKSNLAIFNELKPSAEEEVAFAGYRDSLTSVIPNTPVIINERLYDIEVVLNCRDARTGVITLSNQKYPFYLRDIQPASEIQKKIESALNTLHHQREAALKAKASATSSHTSLGGPRVL